MAAGDVMAHRRDRVTVQEQIKDATLLGAIQIAELFGRTKPPVDLGDEMRGKVVHRKAVRPGARRDQR